MDVIQFRCSPAAARNLAGRVEINPWAAAAALELMADVAEDAEALAHKFQNHACDACLLCGNPSASVEPEACDCGCHDTARRARRILDRLGSA